MADKLDNLELTKKELEATKAELARVRKELKAAQDGYLQAEEDTHKLRSLLAERKAAMQLPEGADGAHQIGEPCTFVAVDGAIVNAVLGDLVLVTTDTFAAKTMQRKLGHGHRVYAVSEDTLRSLDSEGLMAR